MSKQTDRALYNCGIIDRDNRITHEMQCVYTNLSCDPINVVEFEILYNMVYLHETASKSLSSLIDRYKKHVWTH